MIGLKCSHCASYNTTRIGGDDPLPVEAMQEMTVLTSDSDDEGEHSWETISVESLDNDARIISDDVIANSDDVSNNPDDVRNNPDDVRNNSDDVRNNPDDVQTNQNEVRNDPDIRSNPTDITNPENINLTDQHNPSDTG